MLNRCPIFKVKIGSNFTGLSIFMVGEGRLICRFSLEEKLIKSTDSGNLFCVPKCCICYKHQYLHSPRPFDFLHFCIQGKNHEYRHLRKTYNYWNIFLNNWSDDHIFFELAAASCILSYPPR
ncbi:Uncharacterized protein Fot_42971 [Forsythia ovata]|uniref:Uncharacterized protein n=1 Tax=Forsythia ovata TaxID=205694 RepID=A0ABD1RMP4_9LAMI